VAALALVVGWRRWWGVGGVGRGVGVGVGRDVGKGCVEKHHVYRHRPSNHRKYH
jgi:hypothetical protein